MNYLAVCNLYDCCAQLDSGEGSHGDENSSSGGGKVFGLSILASMPSRDALARGDIRAHAPRQWLRVGRLKVCDDGRLPVLAATALTSSHQVRLHRVQPLQSLAA